MVDYFTYNLINFFEFVLTLIIEFFVFWIGTREKAGKVALYVLLINAFTWPLISIFVTMNNFLFLELFVFVIEAVLITFLFRIRWWKASIISFIANFITALMGVFAIAMFGF